MKLQNKLILTALIILGFASSILFFQQTSIKPAPNVTLTTIKGEKIVLQELQGKPVLINFWATDCAVCIKEIPHLIELYNQFHPMGLEIIAITMYYDIPSHVVEMSQDKKLPYPIALDLKAEHAYAFGKVELTPTTLLISPTGKIIKEVTGLFDFEQMKRDIQQLIRG